MSRVSRRNVLRGTLLFAAGAAVGPLLAACGAAPTPTPPPAKPAEQKPAAPPPTQPPAKAAEQPKPAAATPTQAPAKVAAPTPTSAPAAKAPAKGPAKPITFLCRNDIVTAYGADPIIAEWNKTHEAKLTLEKPAGDVATKAQAAIAADDMVWDGFSVIEAPWNTPAWVKRGIIAPLDDLIRTSTEPDAQKVLPGMIGTIRESVKVDGKVYQIPGNVGSVALQWFWDPLRDIGQTKQPETWDETAEAARKLQGKYPKHTPFASILTPLCDLYALMWGAIKPGELVKDNVLNIQHQDAISGLKWMKLLAKEGLMPTVATDVNANWDKGTVVMMLAYDVKGQHAQKTYGYDKADTGINIFKRKGDVASGTPFWMNGSVIFNKAKNPQGMMDFFLYWFGPSNAAAQKTLVATAAKPCYTYTYEKFVVEDPKFKWEQTGIDLVAKSAPFPISTYFGIEMNAIKPWVEKFMAADSTISAEDAMAGAAKDRAAEIAKQKL